MTNKLPSEGWAWQTNKKGAVRVVDIKPSWSGWARGTVKAKKGVDLRFQFEVKNLYETRHAALDALHEYWRKFRADVEARAAKQIANADKALEKLTKERAEAARIPE